MALATGQITINNIEETISVVFSKDNHVFPGGVSSALADEVDISVKAYIGTEEVAYTFGSVTPATPTGLTITPSSANKKITLKSTTALTQASGTYNVQVLVKGVTITKTLSYTISFKGTAGKGISLTAIAYKAHTNGTTAPTGTWEESPPVVADNQYLWTRTIITYTDTTTSTSYSVGLMGRGSNGTDGLNGADAKLATIVASSKIFKSRDGGATFSPDNITLTPVFQGGITYLNWQYSTNGGSTWTTVTTQSGLSIDSTTKVLTISKASTLFTTLITDIVFRVNTNISTVYDTVNITKIYDVVDLTQQAIFNKLTNNGAEQGLFLDAGKVYLNGEYLKVSNLVAGDTLIQNGYINTAVIKDASITSAKIASLAANKIVANSITTNQLSSEVGQNLNLSSNNSINLIIKEVQVGGENLIRKSHMLSDKFEVYQGSVYTTLKDGISVPAWGADNATQVRTSSVGTSDLKARWLISDDVTFMTGKEMSFSIWAKNNRTDQSVTIGTNRIGEPITLNPLESRKLEFIGVLPANEAKLLVLEVRASSSGIYVDVTLWHPKWELGNKVTEWSQHPDELYTGVTRIDKEGVNVSRSNSEVNTQIAYDGLRVLDGDNITASMVEGIASIPELYTDRVHGDVINTHPGGTINIGADRDFTTINEALTAIGNRKHLLGDLVFNVYSLIIEDIVIRGFSGGMLYIRIQAGGAIHGDITFYQNSAGAYLIGAGARRLVKGTIKITGGNAFIQDLIVSPGSTTATGIVSEYGSQVFITGCDLVNARFGVLAQHGGTIMALNNIGEITLGAIYNTYNGGVLHAKGTMPLGSTKFGGTSSAFWYDFTTTQLPSQYQLPTASPTLISQTFGATKLETYSYQYSAISSYYPGRAAQNRWDTGTGYFEGRIFFSGALRNYINDRDGDANLKVELQVRRYSGTNGSSSGVAPDNQFAITGGSFGAVSRGAWSGWVTISPTLIPTTGYTFKFGSQSTGNKYAVWDDARIRVVKTKNL